MYIGQDLQRLDAHDKVIGAARYAAEFQVTDTVHAVLVQSTIAAGSIAGFDLTAAQGMPGVLAIITPDNAEKLKKPDPNSDTVTRPLLQDSEVLYSGQHIAVVVGQTLDEAIAAAAAVRVSYHESEAITAMEQALHLATMPKQFNNGRSEADTSVGNADAAFAAAVVKVEAVYKTPIEHHNPMEPHATIAAWDGDTMLTVWTATQAIAGSRQTLTELFGLKPENVTVLCPYVGGGFGSKGSTWPHVVLAAMAARAVKRPVKLVLTREQMFSSNGYRPMTIQTVKLGADKDGKLVSVRHDGLTSTSMPEQGEFAETVGVASRMLYASPNIATSHRVVALNHGKPTFMRGPGETPGMFALESAMDELAVALKLDPVELRLRNYADSDPTEKKPFASKDLRECYMQGARAFGWDSRTPEPRSMRKGPVLIGYGMASSTYPTNRMAASARVRLMPDGTAVVQSATQDIGTGTYTIMAQVAADALGLPIEKIRTELGDSRLPHAPVSGGSMTTGSVMPAVLEASVNARTALFRLAIAQGGDAWQTHSLDDLRFENATVHGPSGSLPIADLIARQNMPYVEGEADAKPTEEAQKYSKHSFGAHFVEVHVDADLGTIHVARWVAAFDCGRVLNRRTGRSQLLGGIVFGIGMALHEETLVDTASGRITNANISEYLMPVNADVPDIETIIVDTHDPISNPQGSKGIGELPTVGAAAAIANAIYHATGVRVRDLPIRLDRLLT